MRERVTASILNNNSSNFWSEVKRLHGNRIDICKQVDGITESKNISQLFATKYCSLYNDVAYDAPDMQL